MGSLAKFGKTRIPPYRKRASLPNPNNGLRYWDLADHIRIDDAIALWRGAEPAELAQLNFDTQRMSAKRAELVAATRTERLEYEDLGIVTARGQRSKARPSTSCWTRTVW